MAVFIDEPTPIARSTASQLLGTVTPAGVLASQGVGVVAQQYISAIYGNGQNKAGQTIYLNQTSIMDVLNYSGRIVPAVSWLVKDSSATDGTKPSSAFNFRIGFKVTTTPQSGTPAIFNNPMNGALNPISSTGNGVTNPFGAYGWIGQLFEVFGAKTYILSSADLIAGQLPNINIKMEIYFAWVNTPPPAGVVQLNITPTYQDNSIVLPAPYYFTPTTQRGKSVTTRGFSYDNLTALQTPYNILPNPYAGTGVSTGNVPTSKSKLQALYREFKSVANGGPSYQYVPGDTFPASALLFSCDLNLQVFPPLYYVYGIDYPTSTINWYSPSYSANPLDSRP
jgi:hypothetical protein